MHRFAQCITRAPFNHVKKKKKENIPSLIWSMLFHWKSCSIHTDWMSQNLVIHICELKGLFKMPCKYRAQKLFKMYLQWIALHNYSLCKNKGLNCDMLSSRCSSYLAESGCFCSHICHFVSCINSCSHLHNYGCSHLLWQLEEIIYPWVEISTRPVLSFDRVRKSTNIFVCDDKAPSSLQKKYPYSRSIPLVIYFRRELECQCQYGCVLYCSKVWGYSFHTDQTFPPRGPDSGTKQRTGGGGKR